MLPLSLRPFGNPYIGSNVVPSLYGVTSKKFSMFENRSKKSFMN